MSAPQSPSLMSLLTSRSHSTPPVCDWVQLISTEQEMTDLLFAVQGIPAAWLKWADQQAIKMHKRRTVHSRVGYALTTLWNGITLLQECKFLADVLENALRVCSIGYISLNRITYDQLYPKPYLEQIRNLQSKVPADGTSIIQPDFIVSTSFEQLTRTLSLNWEQISSVSEGEHLDGFRRLFWDEVHLRDVNLFKSDMGTIRNYRNDIAHSKRLFALSDVNRINRIVCKWLKPLNVELMQKVISYRKNRPRFLQDLGGD